MMTELLILLLAVILTCLFFSVGFLILFVNTGVFPPPQIGESARKFYWRKDDCGRLRSFRLKLWPSNLRKQRLDMLATLIDEFERQGKREVSFPEILDSVEHLNDCFPVKYAFLTRWPYPPELGDDLSRLEYHGVMRRFKMQHDGVLPKTFIALTAFGKGRANNVRSQVLAARNNLLNRMHEQVARTIKQSEDWWKLWCRYE